MWDLFVLYIYRDRSWLTLMMGLSCYIWLTYQKPWKPPLTRQHMGHGKLWSDECSCPEAVCFSFGLLSLHPATHYSFVFSHKNIIGCIELGSPINTVVEMLCFANSDYGLKIGFLQFIFVMYLAPSQSLIFHLQLHLHFTRHDREKCLKKKLLFWRGDSVPRLQCELKDVKKKEQRRVHIVKTFADTVLLCNWVNGGFLSKNQITAGSRPRVWSRRAVKDPKAILCFWIPKLSCQVLLT